MSRSRRIALLLAVGSVLVQPAAASACSPPFEEPTIAALGPRQVVVVGTIGEKLGTGRVFHVERWFNGGTLTRIIIGFKEGEPLGDCSYPVSEGQRLIIAPEMAPDGTLSAILPTLQADPDSELGRRYVAEATDLFGPGVVPAVDPVDEDRPGERLPPGTVAAAVLVAVAALFAVVVIAARRQT